MRRVPLLAGSRIVVVEVPDDGVVLQPPPPREAIDDVGAAVREALRFPLGGPPLAELARRGGTATLVIELPALPIPGAAIDPRHAAIAETVDELDRLGVSEVTILVAGALQRRVTPREVALLLPPEFRRRFRGRVLVHDAEAPDLVEIGRVGTTALRINPALLATDLIVTVTAAETVLNGGPNALLAACAGETLRGAGAVSLLETSASQGWQLAIEVERLLATRVPLAGVSLVLNLPRVLGGYPYEADAVDRIVRSKLRRGMVVLPGPVRARLIERIPRDLSAAAVFGGFPSLAHAEALVRATAFKGIEVAEPLDAIVIGTPATTPFFPRERPNPLSAAYLGLGLALRLWRGASPVRSGGVAILVHPFQRQFSAPSQAPYRAVFSDPRTAADRDDIHEAEDAAATDPRALSDYRAGRSIHPLRPFVELGACKAVAAKLDAVLIAGCRDAHAARHLGFVPAHGMGAALAMARESGAERVGFLLSPPYFPLLVSEPR